MQHLLHVACSVVDDPAAAASVPPTDAGCKLGSLVREEWLACVDFSVELE